MVWCRAEWQPAKRAEAQRYAAMLPRLAKLQRTPEVEWSDMYFAGSLSVVDYFDQKEWASTWRALAELRLEPPRQWQESRLPSL